MILQQPLNAILQCITNHAFQAEKGRSDRAKHRLHKSIQLDPGLVWPAALDVSRGKRAQLIGNRPAYGKGISFRVRRTHDLFSIFLFLLYLRTRTYRGPFFQTFVFFPTTCSIPLPTLPPYRSQRYRRDFLALRYWLRFRLAAPGCMLGGGLGDPHRVDRSNRRSSGWGAVA